MDAKVKTAVPVMFEQTEDLSSDDDRFTKVRIWMMHLGQNYNGSIFEKTVVEEAIPTLGYIPIVGFIEVNSLGEEDFSDHRYVIKRKNGEFEMTYIGMPYGCVLSEGENNAHFEKRLCDDGITREFLVVDGLMWNQFKGAEILQRDEIKSHSMELHEPSVEGYEDEDGLFHFTRFSFRAACILGKDQSPAMEGSTVELQFSMSDFITAMQDEIINKMALYTRLTENTAEGGNPLEGNKNTDFTLSVMESIDEIVDALRVEEFVDRWGWQTYRYYLLDIQGDEVIAIDRKNNYRKVGMKFSVEGDKITIDFASAKRKKTVYEDFEESAPATTAESNFEALISGVADYMQAKIDQVSADKDTATTEFAALKSEMDEIKPKYEEYVAQETARIESETKAAKDALFAKFDAHLASDNRYVELKEKMNDFSAEEIEGRCSIYFTEAVLKANQANFNRQGTHLVLDIPEQLEDPKVVHTKYGVIRKG